RIRDAKGGATRVKELVSKLRTFSRLDEGRVKTVGIQESVETGLVSCRPGRITLVTEQQNGDFVFRVRDTGKGIPEETRNRIFEPFFTTKPIGEGTGLGLGISYGIMKAHQGSMEFSTKTGEGTEFTLKIPVA